MTSPAETPFHKLPEAGAIQAIEELLSVARDAGLSVNQRIRPDVWLKIIPDQTYDALERAVFALARSKPGAWLNTPADLLALLPEAIDPDVRVWEAIEREVAARGSCELSHLPGFTVRHYLALTDCGTLAWDLAHADHPLRRQEIRTRFLAACRLPRPEPVALLEAPALPYREALRAHRTREITARAAPLLLPIDE